MTASSVQHCRFSQQTYLHSTQHMIMSWTFQQGLECRKGDGQVRSALNVVALCKALVTPVPKKNPPRELSDLRPIMVTPSLSRLTERLIVRKYVLPSIPSDQLTDQFAYEPSGSTTAALIATTHHISRLLETCSYVRCIFIDYSKAFDTINHPIHFQKLLQLPLPSNILLWIFNFLTNRMQAVFSLGQTSTCLPVTQSIIQRCGIGPCLYLIYESNHCTLSPQNVIITYADDTTLLVAKTVQ